MRSPAHGIAREGLDMSYLQVLPATWNPNEPQSLRSGGACAKVVFWAHRDLDKSGPACGLRTDSAVQSKPFCA
jgi:hypothetical protein